MAQSESLALAGNPPAHIPVGNLGEWVFSNPFHADGEIFADLRARVGRNARTPISTIPKDKPFLVNPYTNSTLSWSQAQRDSLKIAASFQQRGIAGHGMDPENCAPPIILLHLPNCHMFAPLLYGALASGLAATMTSPALTVPEVDWVLLNSKPVAIVTTRAAYPVLREAIARQPDGHCRDLLSRPDRIFLVDLATDDYCGNQPESRDIPAGATNWKVLLDAKPLARALRLNAEQCRNRPAVILWSSGTSGKSKGVLVSHQAMTSACRSVWEVYKTFGDNERWIGFIPFYHTFGLMTLMLLGPAVGATIYPMPKFDADQMLDLIPRKRITFLQIAPPVAMMLSKSPKVEGVDFSSVKAAVSGGAPVDTMAIEQIYKRFGFQITVGYGSSEAATISHTIADTWEENIPQLGSIGLPLHGIEVKIVSIDNPSKIEPLNVEGEIVSRSPSNMLGYLNSPDATAEVLMEDGWLHTGDLGKLDDNGFLWITGRLKEMLKVKGLQVSPPELDATLCASPYIAEAAVTSIYDRDAGSEFPRAYIVPAEPGMLKCCESESADAVPAALQELAEHVKSWTEERLANYKWLRGNVVFVKAVPKNPTGKILRRFLKDTKGIEVIIYPKKYKPMTARL